MSKVHLVSFYTEGDPKDFGDNLRELAKVFKKKADPYFDSVSIFCPRTLCLEDAVFLNLVANYEKYVTKQRKSYRNVVINPIWARIGFMMWKPRLIAKIYDKVSNDDIVVFHDVNYIKYPQYLDGIENWKPSLIKLHHASNILLFRDCFKPLAIDCKRYLIKKYLGKYKYPDFLPGFWAGMVSFKKSNQSDIFLKKWIELTEYFDNVSPYPDLPKISTQFQWHSPEQATLAITYYLTRAKIKIAIVYARSRIFPISGLNRLYFLSYLYTMLKEFIFHKRYYR